MFKTLALAAALLLAHAAPAPAVATDAPTVVIVVRHAEKAAAGGDDPSLSDAGRERAARLAGIAEQAGVQAVITTQLKRTRETAQPFLARRNAPARAFELSRANLAAHPKEVADEVRKSYRGQTVLVVGHSNTAPRIVNELTGQSFKDLDDPTEFDALFVVVIPAQGRPTVLKAKY
jgi:broad specificity phosphatase PhoE